MKLLLTGICLILLAGLGASASTGQSSVAGEWAGGYEIRGQYTPIRARFRLEGAGIKGTLDLPFRGETGVALDQVRFLSPNLHFELPRGAGPLIFDGQLSGDFITGNIQYSSERGTFHLVRTVTLDSKVFDQYVGDYQLGRDRYITIEGANQPTAGITYTICRSTVTTIFRLEDCPQSYRVVIAIR